MKRNKKVNITKLKKEIEVKDFIVQELLKIITKNNITVRENLMKIIHFLYKGEKV